MSQHHEHGAELVAQVLLEEGGRQAAATMADRTIPSTHPIARIVQQLTKRVVVDAPRGVPDPDRGRDRVTVFMRGGRVLHSR